MPDNAHPFAKYAADAWPYQFTWSAQVVNIHGGTPRNPDVVRAWLKAKAGWTDEHQIESEVAKIFAVDPTRTDEEVAIEATKELADKRVNAFRRDENGLYLEGRCLKACIKEGASVARATNKIGKRWGETGKGVHSFVAEHICVVEDRLYLGCDQADEIATSFVTSRYGTGIQVEEVINDAKITATIRTDFNFTEKDWAMIWLTAEEQGLGASRSQGHGRFTVTEWRAPNALPTLREANR